MTLPEWSANHYGLVRNTPEGWSLCEQQSEMRAHIAAVRVEESAGSYERADTVPGHMLLRST